MREYFGMPGASCQQVKDSVGKGDFVFIRFFPTEHVDKTLSFYRACQKRSILKYIKSTPYTSQTLFFFEKPK